MQINQILRTSFSGVGKWPLATDTLPLNKLTLHLPIVTDIILEYVTAGSTLTSNYNGFFRMRENPQLHLPPNGK